MNKTKRILMAEQIERAANDKLAKLETIKISCSECGRIMVVKMVHDESKRITCEKCRTSYGITAHNVDK